MMETVQTELGGDASDMKSIAMKKPAVVLRCKDMSAVEKFSSLMTEQYGASRVQVQPKVLPKTSNSGPQVSFCTHLMPGDAARLLYSVTRHAVSLCAIVSYR